MIGSLFSGYGGLDMAVRDVLGEDVAWHCDNDPASTAVLAHRWPGVPNLGDVTAVTWSRVPRVQVLTGGFPCQDVSLAGRREGLADGTRSGLWAHMATAIDHLRPSIVVIENVRGLLSARADSDVEPCPWCLGDEQDQPALRALGAVLGDLAHLGYDATWTGLRAADIGAPHGRYRIFIVAAPAGHTHRVDRPGGRPQDSHGKRDLRLDLLPTPTTADGTGGPGNSGRDGGLNLRTAAATLLPTPDATHGRKTSRTGLLLPGAVETLLPTPTATPYGNN